MSGGGKKGQATRKLYHLQPLPGQFPAWSLPAVGRGHFPEERSRGALPLAAAAATASERRRLTGGHGFCVWAGKRKRRLWSPPPSPPGGCFPSLLCSLR